jgi:antitoxin component YwqK of YwqJK toxin-antitoxin module
MNIKTTSIAITLFLCSCHSSSSNRGQAAAGVGAWVIRDSTVRAHAYGKDGLLDSTLQIVYLFHNGQINGHLSTLIIYWYDAAGRLTEERSFIYSERFEKWELHGKHVKAYDVKGDLVNDEEIDMHNGRPTLSNMDKMTYNQRHQEVTRFRKMQRIEPDPNWNVDSGLAHLDDVKILQYDTSIISSIYDTSAHLVTTAYKRSGATGQSFEYTTYIQGMKTASYIVNRTGDTTIIYHFDKDGDLTRKIEAYNKEGMLGGADTIWYRGDKEVKTVYYYHQPGLRDMKVLQYDDKGNVIREMNYQ